MNKKTHDQFISLRTEGTFALQKGAISEATVLLEKAYALQPDDMDVRLNLSGAYILSKQFKKAVPLLEKLTEEAPHNPMFWVNLGAAYLGNPVLSREHEQRQAVEAFATAVRLDPRTPNAAYNLGLVHRDLKEYERALHWFEEAVAANPDDDDARYYARQMIEKINAAPNDPSGDG